MSGIFIKEFELRSNDFDCKENILPSTVLDICQSTAGQHAIMLGCGFEDLLKKDLLWVLVKVKYRVIKFPTLYQKIRVTTWPLPPERVTLNREHLITDTKGEPLILVSSQWTTVNKTERRLAPTKEIYNLSENDFCLDKNFEGKFTRVPTVKTQAEGKEITAGYCDIDLNGHVNNTKYANFILNAFPPKAPVKELQIDYHKEIMQDSKVFLFKEETENGLLVVGKNEQQETMFSARIEY